MCGMEEEIRKKYERLLVPPDGSGPVGEMTEKELLLGRILKKIREHRQISQEDLAEGICPISVLATIENGTKANLLLTNILLTRMGKSSEKFEFYYTNGEYEQQREREQILELWKSDKLSEAMKQIRLYERRYKTKFNTSWSDWQRRCIMLKQDTLPKKFEQLWLELQRRKLYFTQEEWDFLWELAKMYERTEQKEKLREVYSLMYQNSVDITKISELDGHGMDEERQLEILPLLCLNYGRFEHKEEHLEEAETVLNTGIELLIRNMRLYYLRELLEERTQLCYRLWKDTKSPERYQKLVQDEQNLIALDFMYHDEEKAYQKIKWLKEELKWESTTLDNLSIGPERLWQ